MELSEPDCYGQQHLTNEHPNFIREMLEKLEVAIDNLPKQQIENYKLACTMCPSLVDDAFKLMFLRCELYRVNDAAERLARYWDKRLELFGSEKAFLPLTQNETLKDDRELLNLGFIRLLSSEDPSGRIIVMFDPSLVEKSKSQEDRKAMGRVIWYIVHKALESESTQQKGMIWLANLREFRLSQYDSKLGKSLSHSETKKGCLPMRVSAIHMCHPPTFFAVVWPLIKHLLGDRVRKRVRVWTGSDKNLLVGLKPFGLTEHMLPTKLGGKCW